jgi:hypothetical protein
MPPLPAVERPETHRTTIRIHSEMKLPERVIFDTDRPPIAHRVEPVIADAGVPRPPSGGDVSPDPRQAFAQLQPSDASKTQIIESKRPELRRAAPVRKREARKHAAGPRKFRVARQPQFDWFGGGMWW